MQLRWSSNELIISAFKEEIQIGPPYPELSGIPPSSALDIWKIAQTYVVADDAMWLRMEQEKKNGENKHKANPAQLNICEIINKGRVAPCISMNNLTPLMHSKSEILVLHRNLLRLPLPLQAPHSKPDKN